MCSKHQRTPWTQICNMLGQKPRLLVDNRVGSEAEIFGALQKKLNLPDQAQRSVKLYIDGSLQKDILSLLPNKNDINYQDYGDRLLQVTHAKSFLLYASNFPNHVRYAILNDLLRKLGEIIPGSTRDLVLEAFLGQYPYTPGGIHCESGGNLHTILAGQKSMLFWPRHTWSAERKVERQVDPTSGEEEIFLPNQSPDAAAPQSICLSAKAGDLLYWPPYWWHIGSSRTMCLSCSITFRLGQTR